ncbi:uncharacterized protein LOC144102050 isoform X2 [Amblyomma americanum]
MEPSSSAVHTTNGWNRWMLLLATNHKRALYAAVDLRDCIIAFGGIDRTCRDVMGDQCARCGLICARTSAWCPCRWRLSLLREYIFGGCHSTCCDGFYAHGCSREQRQRPTSAIQPAGSILLSGLVARALMAFMAMAIAACQTEAEFHNPVSSGC